MSGIPFRSNIPCGMPFSEFFHCPRCGATSLALCGERVMRCKSCGFEYYFNCASAVAAFLLHKGRLILTVRGSDPQKGMLDLPGGFVEFGETVEQALRREIAEELNLQIGELDYLASAPNDYSYGGVVYKTTDLYFYGEVEDLVEIKAGDDVASYRLVKPAELDVTSLAFPSVAQPFRKLVEVLQRRQPNTA